MVTAAGKADMKWWNAESVVSFAGNLGGAVNTTVLHEHRRIEVLKSYIHG